MQDSVKKNVSSSAGGKVSDTLTILTCVDHGAIATKRIECDKDGNIKKHSFSSGKYFTHREIEVCDIWSLGKVIQSQETRANEVLIRGVAAPESPKIAMRRKIGSEGGIFNDPGKRWVMFDIDDFPLPEWIDPAKDPEAAVKWVRAALPRPFRKVTCFYQFSTSQNLPERKGEAPPKIAKLHLFFWLDKPVTSEQWRDYIDAQG